MTGLRVVVLEDEPPAQARVVTALRRADPTVAIAAVLPTVALARAYFAAHPAPDLVVSDIVLADGNALALFRERPIAAPVIFATAHDRYVLDAFRCAAVDYLLKPIADADVARALTKLASLRALFAADAAALDEVLAAPHRRMLVQRGASRVALDHAQVAYVRADDKLTIVVAADGREYTIDRSLAALARELDPRAFFRANRATLVQRGAVRAYRSLGKGRLALRLEPPPPDEVVVSQENGAAFRAWFVDG